MGLHAMHDGQMGVTDDAFGRAAVVGLGTTRVGLSHSEGGEAGGCGLHLSEVSVSLAPSTAKQRTEALYARIRAKSALSGTRQYG